MWESKYMLTPSHLQYALKTVSLIFYIKIQTRNSCCISSNHIWCLYHTSLSKKMSNKDWKMEKSATGKFAFKLFCSCELLELETIFNSIFLSFHRLIWLINQGGVTKRTKRHKGNLRNDWENDTLKVRNLSDG